MWPVRVKAPVTSRLPAVVWSVITPEKVFPPAAVRNRVLPFSQTVPAPPVLDSVLMCSSSPIENTPPAMVTPLDAAIVSPFAPSWMVSVPPLMVVAPVKSFFAVSTSEPAVSVSPPVPPMSPEKVSLALERVRVRAPRVTTPAPPRDTIDVPGAVTAEMSKVPPSCTDDPVIAPAVFSARVSPEPMVVVPVKLVFLVSVHVPVPSTVRPAAVPVMSPAKVPLAVVMVRVLEPRARVELAEAEVTSVTVWLWAAPWVSVPEPVITTPLESAMVLPVAELIVRSPPLMSVAPV